MRMRARLAAVGLAGVLAGAGGPVAGPALAAGRAVHPAGAPAAGVTTAIAGGPGRGPGWSVAQQPVSLATGPGGAVYVGDHLGVVRRFGPSATWESVVAGLGQNPVFSTPYLGDSRLADRASLSHVGGLALDPAGNLLIADSYYGRVRVLAAASGTVYGRTVTAGHIYTVAGRSRCGGAGDGHRAVSGCLHLPQGLAVDAAGNLVIADTADQRVRVVAATTGTFYGQAMTAGDIYTVAGNGGGGYSGDGGPATTAELDQPAGVAVDATGNLVIADSHNYRVRVVAASSGTFYGQAMTAGNVYTVAGTGRAGFSGDGGPAAAARVGVPAGLVLDGAGNVVLADTSNSRVRVLAAATGTFYGLPMTAGDIYTVAGAGSGGFSGNGGPATAAGLGGPVAVAIGSAGDLVIAGGYDRVWVLATAAGHRYGRVMAAGHIYTVAGTGVALSGNGRLARNAELATLTGVAAGPGRTPDVAVWDRGEVRLVAPASRTVFGQPMTAGHIYIVAGTGVPGDSGDGGPATAALIGSTGGLALDTAGNLVIGDTRNNRVRVVAASAGTFYGQAMTAGDIYTVAGTGTAGFSGDGSPATAAQFSGPTAVTVDGAGNLVLATRLDNRVRVVAASAGTFYGQAMAAGDIYTVAGTGTTGFSGDHGPATAARMHGPFGVAVDGAGNLVVADSSNSRIRVVAASTGTFYGQAMTAGNIYTVAGNGTAGPCCDGGPALSAEVEFPQTVTVGAGGTLVFTGADRRVRVVAAASGTFYGVPMTAGDIYGLAGISVVPRPGVPAALAVHLTPAAVAADAAGDILITDSDNRRVWETGG
jgi:hypothetical protein